MGYPPATVLNGTGDLFSASGRCSTPPGNVMVGNAFHMYDCDQFLIPGTKNQYKGEGSELQVKLEKMGIRP